MSSDAPTSSVAIAIRDVGKCYHIYDRPIDRLKQALWRGQRQFFREFWALRGVCFELRRGETIGIIGRNGAGKSTLLQLLCGTLTPTEGEVEIYGRVAALLELGSGFNPEFTGRENVYMNGGILGLSREQVSQRFESITAFADIGDFIDQPVKTYSSGMAVRLAFAVAISVDPDILVVDEALAVGDIFFQQRCMRHLRENLAQTTKILVTHDLHAVTTLANRVLVIENGRLALDAPPLEAVEYYTKSVHNQTFRTREISPPAAAAVPDDAAEDIAFNPVKEQDRGGAGEVVIEKVAVLDSQDHPASIVQAGDVLVVRMLVRASVPKDSLVFGYMINDRLGNALCGETTLSLPAGPLACPDAGRYRATLRFRWPEIRPGEYTVTLGIGEGSHPLSHIIQCWAHNVAALTCISPTKVIHCVFNNPLDEFELAPLNPVQSEMAAID